jgi:hypothetical protein
MPDSFTHNTNTLSNNLMLAVIRKYGMEGIGIYWTLLESLCNGGGKLELSSLDDISFAMHVTLEVVEDMVRTSGLFMMDDLSFWSDSLLTEIKEKEERGSRFVKRARKAASKRWEELSADSEVGNENATSMLQASKSDAISILQASDKHATSMQACMLQASKEKEEKETPPMAPLPSPPVPLFSPPYNPPSEKEEREGTPVNAPTVEPKKTANVISLDSLLLLKVPEGYREAFREFLAFRKQVKKQMTPHAVDLAVAKLDRDLQTDKQRQECLRMSILNGWQGVFPEALLKQRDGPKANPSGFKQRTKTDFDYWGDSPEEA